MKTVLKAAAVAAAMIAGSAASAAVVVWNPGSPSGAPLPPVFSSVSPGDSVNFYQSLVPGDSSSYVFTATSNLKISDIAIAGTGAAADLGNVEFGLTSATTNGFTTIITPVPGMPSSGYAFLTGFSLAAGQSFTLYYEDGISAPVGITTSFTVSAVPVPAALPLLAGALGALGIARRRKAAVAA